MVGEGRRYIAATTLQPQAAMRRCAETGHPYCMGKDASTGAQHRKRTPDGRFAAEAKPSPTAALAPEGAGVGATHRKTTVLKHLQKFQGDYMTVDVEGADYRNTSFRGVNLVHCRMPKGKFNGADFTGASFVSGDFGGADFSDVRGDHADFHQTKMIEARFCSAKMPGACFWHLDLRDSDLRGTDFKRGKFSFVDLRGADLRGADLALAHLHKVDMRGANLEGATLPDDLHHTALDGAILPNGSRKKGEGLPPRDEQDDPFWGKAAEIEAMVARSMANGSTRF